MLVCRVFTPGKRPHETEPARRRYYDVAIECEKRWPGAAKFIEAPTQGDYGYRDVLKWLWEQPEDICIVEQDFMIQPRMLWAFGACPCSLCAQAYTIYPVSTGLPKPVIAHRVEDPNNAPPYRWIDQSQGTADIVGLGFVRIGKQLKPREQDRWIQYPVEEVFAGNFHHTNCDTLLSQYLKSKGNIWHIHWPEVEHLHV